MKINADEKLFIDNTIKEADRLGLEVLIYSPEQNYLVASSGNGNYVAYGATTMESMADHADSESVIDSNDMHRHIQHPDIHFTNTSNVTDVCALFDNYRSMAPLDLTEKDTSNVIDEYTGKNTDLTFQHLLDALRTLVYDLEYNLYYIHHNRDNKIYPKWFIKLCDNEFRGFILFRRKTESSAPNPYAKIEFVQRRTCPKFKIGRDKIDIVGAFITIYSEYGILRTADVKMDADIGSIDWGEVDGYPTLDIIVDIIGIMVGHIQG